MLVPVALGHAAPPPRDFETRIIHDSNDDSVLLGVNHGFDSIALDARTGALPTGEPALILRLLLNGGCKAAPESPDPAIPEPDIYGECPELKEVVEFTLNGTQHQAEFMSSDGGQNWTGLPHFVGPMGINDGTRFAIEGYYPINASEIGATATDFFVYGYQGGEAADNMPELVGPVPDPREESFLLESFVLPDTQYLQLNTDETMIDAGGQLSVGVESVLNANQNVTIATVGDIVAYVDGVVTNNFSLSAQFEKTILLKSVGMHDGEAQLVITSDVGAYESARFNIVGEDVPHSDAITSPDIPAGGSWSYTFSTQGTLHYHNHHSGHEGMITISGAGNSTTHRVVFQDGFEPDSLEINVGDTVEFVNDSAQSIKIMGTFGETEEHGEHHPDEGKESPGIGLILLLGLLAMAAIVRRK